MRKIACLALALLCAAAPAAAQEGMPQGAIDALNAAHPGYEIGVYDGWGNETRGQYAAVISKNGDNILCIAEKGVDDPAYILTIDNTNAAYDGDVLPSVLIDSGGDSLYYTYSDGQDSVHYHAVKENGMWGDVDVTLYDATGMGYRSVWSGIGHTTKAQDAPALCYEECQEDEEGNVISRKQLFPRAVYWSFVEQMKLARFNAQLYDADPTDGIGRMKEYPDYWQRTDSTLVQMDISSMHRATLQDTIAGRVVTIDEWDGRETNGIQVLGVLPDAYIDEFHAGDGIVHITNGEIMYTIHRADYRKWYLTAVEPETQRTVGPDWVCENDVTQIGRNDGYVYGDTWWDDFLPGHIDLPSSYEEVHERMDTSAYALVKNPNPEDRLHLRAEADKGAQSLGKFYNRTPVRVLKRGDTWTKVRVGIGDSGLTGYMMTKYLAFSDAEKAEIACAFPQLQLAEGYFERGALMLAEPSRNAEGRGMFKNGHGDMIIGVCGDEWFIIMREDGTVGYVLQSAFWAGNG